MNNATAMPFSAKDIQIMPQRQIDYAIAEYLFGWTRVSDKGGLPPNSALVIQPIPYFTKDYQSAQEVRAWLEQNHPWLDDAGLRATVAADYDKKTGLYAACVIRNHEDPSARRCVCGESLYLAYGRLALLAWIERPVDL